MSKRVSTAAATETVRTPPPTSGGFFIFNEATGKPEPAPGPAAAPGVPDTEETRS